MLFSFVDFKKKEAIEKEIPLVANPENFKKPDVTTAKVSKASCSKSCSYCHSTCNITASTPTNTPTTPTVTVSELQQLKKWQKQHQELLIKRSS
jgi:hypothetical protein